ncbi:hypothetical protein MW887_006071 [Aspergillus wentii]|nr:hypothetical protein MW887_006071 [Aspergillus wentii]
MFLVSSLRTSAHLFIFQCSADITGTPCTECALHNRNCFIDEGADKRRKISVKRTEEELRYYREFVEQLLKAIRQGKHSDVDIIVNAIRSGASQEEIRSVIAHCLGQFPNDNDPGKKPGNVANDLTNNDASTSTTPDGR